MTSRRLVALVGAWLVAMLLHFAPATADHMNGRYVGAGPAQGTTLDLQQRGYTLAGMLSGPSGQAQLAGQSGGGNNGTGMLQMQTGQMAFFQLQWDQGGITLMIVPAGQDGQPDFAQAQQPIYLQRAGVGQMPQQPPQQQPWPQQPQQQPWPQQPQQQPWPQQPQQQPWPQQPPQHGVPQQPWPQAPQQPGVQRPWPQAPQQPGVQQPWPQAPQQPGAQQPWPQPDPAPEQPAMPQFPEPPPEPDMPGEPPQAMDPAPAPQATEPALRFPDHPDMDGEMDDDPSGAYDEPGGDHGEPERGAVPEAAGDDVEDETP